MPAKEIILTREGREALERELAYLEGEHREEIIESLKEARSFGDYSENAELDAAREEQARSEARINEIRHILAVARVVEASDGLELSVSIDTTVEIEDEQGKRTAFTIVGTTETNSLKRRISNESPAGSALIGHTVGDVVTFTTPTGRVRTYIITNITR